MTSQIDGFDVEHLHGPAEISYAEDELVVVCLVRDGLPWVKSFLEHYFSLGAKHLVFLDNGSTDGTVEALERYGGVSVLRTAAPFMGNEVAMRRYLVDRFGKSRWTLSVDIDELFDYPYSDVVTLDSLLRYLNSRSYTAVAARMLDMFPDNLSSDRVRELHEDWQKEHRFYDISGLERSRMAEDRDLLQDNVFDSEEVTVAFRGGIRETLFGYMPWLTKFPLLFSDGASERRGVHSVRNARVANLTCVLLHYKFYAFSLQEYWHKAIEHKKRDEGTRPRHVYEQYLRVLEKNPDLQLKRETAREFFSVNDLLENRFLVASEDYVGWVGTEEERDLMKVSIQSDPRALVEALVESRRRERAKTLTVGRSEQRLLDLERSLGDQDRRTQRLERQVRNRGKKLQRSKPKLRYLSRRIGILERQLEDMRASRVWKLAEGLRRIRVRFKGLLTG